MIGVAHGLNTFTQHVGLGLNPYAFPAPVNGPLVAFTLEARGSVVFPGNAAQGFTGEGAARATLDKTAAASAGLSITGNTGQDFDA